MNTIAWWWTSTCPGGGTGLDVLRNLKKHRPTTGVIIISARDALDDRITGLDPVAAAALTKPFHLPELNARLKAILRRRQFRRQYGY